MNNNKLNSVHLIPLSFLGAILIGTLFLILPVSSAAGQWTPPIDALFTATTSVCVTGLVVVDTFSHWSLFGQVVILLLIQIGGLGVITVVSTLMLIAHKRFSLSARLMLRDAMNLDSLAGLLSFLARVIRGTLIVELAGALLYMIAFIHRHYREKITLEDIAASASISTREATRTFRRIRDKTPVDYLIEYRLNKAGNDLLSTKDSITDIAYRNGFESSAYFGKMFRKHFQMTPSQFRKTAGSQTDLDEPELDEIVEAAALVSEENEKIETAAGRL